MRTCVAIVLLVFCGIGVAQVPPDRGGGNRDAYPELEAVAAWKALAAGYVAKAVKDQTLDQDPVLNARVDRVMAAVGAAVAAIDSRFAKSVWRAILIADFGRGAVAFPGQIILVDASFVRQLALTDEELALILSHEAAHVIAGHAAAKLAFMAQLLGKAQLGTARKALLEFLAKDSYAEVFSPEARLQEREADTIGAAILFTTGYNPQRAMKVFDKLADAESVERDPEACVYETASVRKQSVAAVIAALQKIYARRGEGPVIR